jgi:predicted phage terminase large subunit-like protein|tara:strand:+ start:3298 stop:4761 length:1464 start_codon:yes stop_codon:yes gene_type:complete
MGMQIEGLTPFEQEEALKKLVLRKKILQLQGKQREDFLLFVRTVWPEFIAGNHHKIIAKKFEAIASKKIKRLIVNMPPRHTKSEFASFLFPAWMMGREPRLKIIQTSHTAELAQRFGRKVRNLIDTQDYQNIFPGMELSADSKAAGRWETNAGGEYFSAGVGGAITGRGADLLIIDDPHSEQDALSATALENAWEWYSSGPRQRLQPGGSIVIVMTRWNTKDITGELIKSQGQPKADQWEVIEFPAIMPSDKPVWPEYWEKEELESVKASISIAKWNAQWQQNPTAEEGAIIKREWWQQWEKSQMPGLMHVIQSYDTAFSKKETADYSAITTWGIFMPDERTPNIILLDMKKGRWDFPEMKEIAYDSYKYWEPESVVIEAKATGMPLTQELRMRGIPVINFTPSKGNDKLSRVNAVAPLFQSGVVWAPDEVWAEEVIEECAAFPYGEHDDLVDSMTQALMRFRQGRWIELSDDFEDEPVDTRNKEYY